jgi:hypothetical protein
VLATGATLPLGTAYWSLAGVGVVQLLVVGLIALGSIELEITSLGSEPDPWDAFDRSAQVLAIAAVLLVPAGFLLRQVRIRGRGATQG